MTLTAVQAIEAAKSPPNAQSVLKGAKYQSKLRMLTLPLELDDLNKEYGWNLFMSGLKSKLTPEKYAAVTKYFTYPLSIVAMSNDMLLDLYRVFDGRNANYSVDYPNDRIKDTGQAVLAQLNLLSWIKSVGKTVLAHAPNTVVVIDKDAKGDPILLEVNNEKLRGYEFKTDGSFDYVVFVHSTGTTEAKKKWTRYAVYDDSTYWVVFEQDGNYAIDTENSNPHVLGNCPARFYYDNPLVNKHQFNRSIPIANAKGVMEQWTVIDLFNYYTDNHAAYQITQYADNGCDNDCTDGVIYIDPVLDGENVVVTKGYNTECPSCSKKGLMGPGSAIGVVVGIDKDDMDARNVFTYIAPDIKPLEYTAKKQDGRERKIKENVVGYSNAITSEAVNPAQVSVLVESRKKPLFDIKSHVEDLYKWIAESTIKLTYNVDVVANANAGTEFFILTAKEIQDLIINAKAAGAQATYIEQLNKMLVATEYKHDPNLVARMLITADIQPQPFASQEEARKLKAEGMMSREDYYWHSNFTDLLTDFELSEGSIVAFGSDKTYSEKIKLIREAFEFLISKKIPDEEEDTDDNGQPSPASNGGT